MSVRYFLLHAQQREHGTSDSNISGLQNMETMYDVFCDGNSEKAYSVAKYVAGPPPPFQFILTADEPWLRRHSSDLFCDAIRVTGKKVVCVCHSSKQASKWAAFSSRKAAHIFSGGFEGECNFAQYITERGRTHNRISGINSLPKGLYSAEIPFIRNFDNALISANPNVSSSL